MSEELPSGWAEVALADVVLSPRPKVSPAQYPELPFIGMDHIAPDSMELLGSVPFGSMKSNGGLFYENDVLYGRMRPYLNKVHRAKFTGACSAEFIVLPESQGLDAGFLAYTLHNQKFVKFATAKSAGDRPRVDYSAISSFTIRLPPLAEQRRIVSKIDELFSRIDEGERALERVQKLLERYRQSVLKAAVTGELTREWREQNKDKLESGEAFLARILKARRDAWEQAELEKMKAKGKLPADDKWKTKYKEPVAPDTTELPDLPEGWVWASVDQVGFVTGGLTKNQKRRDFELQLPYLRVANVYANRLELSDIQYIGVHTFEIERVQLKKNDVLVVEGNGSVDQIGRVAIWDGSIENCVHQNHIIKIRCGDWLPPWYIVTWCMSPLGRKLIRQVASSTAGLHTLSISKVQGLPIPVPSAMELPSIQDEFTSMDSILSNLKQSTDLGVKIQSLRQRILKTAFSGKLVPQDPTDEPASVLLERIAAERAASKTTVPKRPHRKKVTA